MRRRRVAGPAPGTTHIDAALAALGADGLRELIRDLVPWFDEATQARFVNALFDRAARGASGWVPEAPTDAAVRDIEAFAEAAARVGYADPAEVDSYLREGSHAFLGRKYQAAFRIFRALLIPVSNGDIDLGQHEMLDEVLSVDTGTCAAQYAVSMYMTAARENRARAVLRAIQDMAGVGHFWEPLHELERVAIEPLPDFAGFLTQWRALLEALVAKHRKDDWDSEEIRWLHEVIRRAQGPEGLGQLARTSRRALDLQAWCRALVEASDWKGALAAFDEALLLVTDDVDARADFLDGAALAAQELGHKDLPSRLRQAWWLAPNIDRLCRWLGSSPNRKVLRDCVTGALVHCPAKAHKQRGLLNVLAGDFASAAKLLSSAPGLGWSGAEHPGHLLFPLFVRLLGGVRQSEELARNGDELSSLSVQDRPMLATPSVSGLVKLAGVVAPSQAKFRATVIRSMRAAAERRIADVIANKRRRHYGHAAALALACAEVDGSDDGAKWLAGIRATYRRYPALQFELSRGD